MCTARAKGWQESRPSPIETSGTYSTATTGICMMDLLVSTGWLAENLGADELRIVDATAFMPGSDRDAATEYAQAHIPGAVFLDLAALADPDDPRPNTVPSGRQFSAHVQALGIAPDSRIVLYDNSPLGSAARAWWLFETFGAQDIAILDGGLRKWTAEGRAVEGGSPAPRPAHFPARRNDSAIVDKEEILRTLDTGATQILDARGMGRFTGEEPEVRPGMVSGHIPGSRCLPSSQLFHADGTWKRGQELRDLFAQAGIDLDRPLITTCGSGVTAAALSFAARLLGKTDVRLYDGSWSEWGADPATPKATGPA